MFARLILPLLMAALALPGALCAGTPVAGTTATVPHGGHDMAAMAGASHDHQAPAPHHYGGTGHCIGCIPPGNWQGPAIAHEAMPQPSPRALLRQAFLAGLTAMPALPPPRRG